MFFLFDILIAPQVIHQKRELVMAYTPKEKYSLIARYKQGQLLHRSAKKAAWPVLRSIAGLRILTQSYPAKSRTHPEIFISWSAD